MTECVHHWILERGDGATSRGYCKRCRSWKRFANHVPNADCRCVICETLPEKVRYKFMVKSNKYYNRFNETV